MSNEYFMKTNKLPLVIAATIAALIQHLYRVEAQLREHRAGPRLRQAMRASHSRPIVERLEKVLLRLKARGRYLPQSGLA
jgi:hypothetical protein